MDFLLEKVKDDRLREIAGVLSPEDANERFPEIRDAFPEYDPAFLWLITYVHEDLPALQNYIAACYRSFHQVLDAKFIKKLATSGGFETHLWEMILCDILASSGKLIPKSEKGADFILELEGKQIQFEAIAPDEAKDIELRALRPDYSSGSFFEHGGVIHDLEFPVLLRAIKGFKDKETKYARDRALVIAINNSKAVGTISDDSYILRRFLFGLGNLTLSRLSDNSYRKGFEQMRYVNKAGADVFEVGFFRNPQYSHVSGVIYTSKSSRGLIPGGWGWGSGIVYVPNPLAHHPVNLKLSSLSRIESTNDLYQEIPAEGKFISTLSL